VRPPPTPRPPAVARGPGPIGLLGAVPAEGLEGAGYVTIDKTYRGKVPLTLVALSHAGRRAFDAYRAQLHAIVAQMPREGP
jgi:hypothetical protein